MNIYLVGGAVRDQLLEIPFKDKDWVVTGATIDEMLEKGYLYADKDARFPVFIEPQTKQEYALARREIKKGAGYRGFEIETSPEISIEDDLIRRDLTINAIAQDSAGHLIDPFNGQDDLNEGLLRHVSPAFIEDPVRLLRIARFAAKLGCWGFRIAHGTHGLMKKMAKQAELDALKPERIWQEMKKALNEPQPWLFFQVLQQCGALAKILPHLSASMGEIKGHDVKNQPSKPLLALQKAVKDKINSDYYYALIFYFSQNADQFKAAKKDIKSLQLLLDFTVTIKSLDFNIYDFLFTFSAFKPTTIFIDLVQLATLIFEIEAEDKALQELNKLVQIAQQCSQIDPKILQQQGFSGKQLGAEIKNQRLTIIQTFLS